MTTQTTPIVTDEERTRLASAVRYREADIRLVPHADGQRTAGEDPEVEIAISSELPVERYDWWEGERYYEVLEHSAEAVDLSYARDGMPFLVGHDVREQVGLVEGVRVDQDRVLRGRVRFSRSARAREVMQDVIDGIRKKVSVGYRIQTTEETKGGESKIPTRTAKRWLPMEASSVPIPADYSVGVGRSAEQAARGVEAILQAARKAQEMTVSDKNTAAQPTVAANEAQAERQRVSDILKLAREHKVPADRAEAWIAEGKTKDDVAAEILRGYGAGQKETTPPAPKERVTLTEKEEREYSIVRGLKALLDGKRVGFEFEVSAEIERQLGKSSSGFFVPSSIRAQNPAMRPDPRLAEPTSFRDPLAVATAGKGAEAKFVEYGGFIDLLRNRMRVLQLGAQMLPGLQGDVSFVNQSAAGSVSWGAETTNAATSSLTIAARTMAPKILQSATRYTRQLLAQAVFSIENLVRLDLALVHALELDRVAINGSGAANQPRGVLNTTGIGDVPIGTNGGAPTYEHIVDVESEITADNADIASLAYLTTARMRGKLKKVQEFASTNGRPVWEGDAMNGYGAFASNQVPSTLVKGTSSDCHAILFAAWSQLMIGEWGTFEVLVDQVTQGPAIIKVMSIQMVDVLLRYPECFAAIKDARIV